MQSTGSNNSLNSKKHLAVIKVHGLISDDELANAEDIIEALEDAFKTESAQALILDINSPGGSPVQSGQIYRAIKTLRQQYDKPVYAIIGDTGASGAYYIAVAADEIYADPASIVGSIGVIAQSVGYKELADKLGLEPRTFAAGEHKDFLSGSRDLQAEEVDHMDAVLADVHQQFIMAVKEGRGERLDTGYNDLFSGLFWTGKQSVEIGLIDGLSSMHEFVKKNYDGLDLVTYTPELNPLDMMARSFGVYMRAQLDQWLSISQQTNAISFK